MGELVLKSAMAHGKKAGPVGGADVSRIDESLIALRRILRAVERYGTELAREAGLTPAQLRVLQIAGARQGVSPKQIATQMRVSQATVSALLDRLVEKEMIERRRSEVDRRQTNIYLTPIGLTTISDSPDALQQKYVKQFESLSGWEQAMILTALERIAAMLDADDIDASPVLDAGIIQRPEPEGGEQD